MSEPPVARVVAAAHGAGKPTVARLLLASVCPVPALLDKDTMYGSFVASIPAGEIRSYGCACGEKLSGFCGVALRAQKADGQ